MIFLILIRKANELFLGELKKYVLRAGMLEVFRLVIKEVYTTKAKDKNEKLKALKTELEQLNNRVKKARDLLLVGYIDASDYKDIKATSKSRINLVENKVFNLNKSTTNIKPLRDKALKVYQSLIFCMKKPIQCKKGK